MRIKVDDTRAAARLILQYVTNDNKQEFEIESDKDMPKIIQSVQHELRRIGRLGTYDVRDLKLPTGKGFIVRKAKRTDTAAYYKSGSAG